jgi:hypothetical protein
MKLEKFDLEKALNGAKVVTRDGREVSQFIKFDTYEKFSLYGVVNDEILFWDIKGRYYEGANPNIDLFLVGKVESIWVNVYKDANGYFWVGGDYFPTFELAQNYAKNQRSQKAKECYLKTIEITDEV